MIVTAPTKSFTTFSPRRASGGGAPDLAYFRQRYPETVTSLGTLPRREEWLRRIWELDSRWRESAETRGGAPPAEEVIVRGAPPQGVEAEGPFDVVYAGSSCGLLDAAVMACRYGRRVLVFDEQGAGGSGRDWNLSEEELRELAEAGPLTRQELEGTVLNRRNGGFVKFHDAASRVKAEPLWLEGLLDVTVDAEALLGLAAEKIRRQGPRGCAVLTGLRFVRAYVEAERVTIEAEGPGGSRRFFRSRLFVDAGGAGSKVARQLNGGRAFTHVRPTVGTVARGFVRGAGRDCVDFSVGEVLVSTEDASDHRQLMWEGFGGRAARDEYSTSLFFFDSVESPADKSLLSLFERYFESLPSYKRRGAGWRVERPVFDYVPCSGARGRRARRRAADERVMLLCGDSAGLAGPLAPGGPLANARSLRARTHLLNLALEGDLTDAASLGQVAGEGGRRVAEAAGLAEFMRPVPKAAPSAVNETLNALMAALGGLDERVRRELFQGSMSFAALRSLLGRTARLYPRIFARVREHFGARGTFWWAANIAEAVWSERRGRAHARGLEAAGPRDEFARQVALYRD